MIEIQKTMFKVFVSSAFLLAVSSFAKPAQADGPSLAQTLDWMDSTYNPHQGGSSGYGLVQLITTNGTVGHQYNDIFSYVNCQMTLTAQEIFFNNRSPIMIVTTIKKFNLSDIDPSSFSISKTDSQAYGMDCGLSPLLTCDTEELDFETRNQKPLMDKNIDSIFPALTGSNHENKNSEKTFVASFHFNDVKYADRFVRAFQHTIELCGGQPSPF